MNNDHVDEEDKGVAKCDTLGGAQELTVINELKTLNFDTQTVSARELHERLNIGTEFAKWFSRMCEYGFGEEDYREVIVKNVENPKLAGLPPCSEVLLIFE